MGLIRVCPVCRLCYDLSEPECPACRTSSDGVPLVDEDAIEAPAAPDVRPPAAVADRLDGAALLNALAARQGPGFALAFDGVTLPVRGRVGIGRDAEFCTIGDHFRAFPATSGRHAMLWVEGETLMIEHRGSNPSWINGVICAPGKPYRLNAGDVVEFGPGLYASVRLEEGR